MKEGEHGGLGRVSKGEGRKGREEESVAKARHKKANLRKRGIAREKNLWKWKAGRAGSNRGGAGEDEERVRLLLLRLTGSVGFRSRRGRRREARIL